MVTSKESSPSLLHLLRLLILAIASLLRRSATLRLRRVISFVTLREFLLHLSFLRHGLRPVTVDLSEASIQLWIPSKTRRKPAVVLIHGFGGNSKWQWERQVGPLAYSFDLYVPDLLFFGQSRTEGPDRSVGFQARCVAEALRRIGVARYSVVGISYGGFVAYRMAVEDAVAMERVVILTSGICATAKQMREMATREEREVAQVLLPQKAEDLKALLRRSMYRQPRWIPTFILEDFIELMYKNQRKERMELLSELLEKGIDLDPLPAIKQETLILWGDKDSIFPLPLAYQLQRHLGEKSRLEVIEDAGHALQLERHHQVNNLIKKFLGGAADNKLISL